MNVIEQFNEQQVKQVHQLFKCAWWAKDRTLDETRRCIEGSQLCIGFLNEHKELIGFTRILSDFIYKAIIFDVIVAEEYRGKGIGQSLLLFVKNHKQLKKVKHFELYCVDEMSAFYEQFGFSDEVGGIKLMRCVNP